MGLHITRSMAATFNLMLGGFLTYLWLSLAQSGDGIGNIKGVGEWLLIVAMIAMTITSVIAGMHLILRRTLEQGLKWNTGVSLCWFLGAVGGIVASLTDGKMGPGDIEAVLVISGMGIVWQLIGWAVRQFKNIEGRKEGMASVDVSLSPITSDTLNSSLAVAQILPTVSLARPSRETKPLILRR